MTSSTIAASSTRAVRGTAAPRVSVVVPVLDKARTLEALLPELTAAVDCHEVILVDGGSGDDTVATARRVLPDVRVVRQVRTGRGNALAAGFAAVTGDVVVTLDADLSADPAEIHRVVAALTDGADVAMGSRYAAGAAGEDRTALRRMGAWILGLIAAIVLRRRSSDLCYGFTAFWADLVPVLGLHDHRIIAPVAGQQFWGDGDEIETVLACRFAAAGAVVVELASTASQRAHGASRLRTLAEGLRVLRTLAVEAVRTVRPSRTPARPRLHTPVRPGSTAGATSSFQLAA